MLQNKTVINKEEIKKIDPMLKCPTQDIVQNLAEGIDEMVPDPDDVPGGTDANLTFRPDLEEADVTALLQQVKNLSKR